MNHFPHTLGEQLASLLDLPRKLRHGLVGIDEDATVAGTSAMQLIMLQTSTWTIADQNDPLGRPSATAITEQLYAAEGGFTGDPDYTDRFPGGSIDDSVGTFSVFGELSADKAEFTDVSYTDLLAVFSASEGTTTKKAFFVGMTLSDDSIAEMQPVDIVRVVPDVLVNAVSVIVRKKEQR